MLIVYVTLFVAASIVAASATSGIVFSVAFIAQGLCTSLMLIAAVPPLVTGWPVSRMPFTGMIMNLGVFGAVALGPTLGGLEASAHAWRPLFWSVSIVAFFALVLALATFSDQAPMDRSAPVDLIANALALVGCVAAFGGAGVLAGGHHDAAGLVALILGVVVIAILVVEQYRDKEPLMPVKQLVTTLPVMGIVIAMSVSAAAISLMELSIVVAVTRFSLDQVAVMFLPEFGGALLTAGLFGALFRSRFTPPFVVSGVVSLAVAALLLVHVGTDSEGTIAAATGLIGYGVGSSVSPSLFIAGFSLRAMAIQRVFAFIELMRGVAAFLVAPVLLVVASHVGSTFDNGVSVAVWICFGLLLAGGTTGVVLFYLGGSSLQTPDLETWQKGEPAWHSPALGERFS